MVTAYRLHTTRVWGIPILTNHTIDPTQFNSSPLRIEAGQRGPRDPKVHELPPSKRDRTARKEPMKQRAKGSAHPPNCTNRAAPPGLPRLRIISIDSVKEYYKTDVKCGVYGVEYRVLDSSVASFSLLPSW